jgi:hypothetical protein
MMSSDFLLLRFRRRLSVVVASFDDALRMPLVFSFVSIGFDYEVYCNCRIKSKHKGICNVSGVRLLAPLLLMMIFDLGEPGRNNENFTAFSFGRLDETRRD